MKLREKLTEVIDNSEFVHDAPIETLEAVKVFIEHYSEWVRVDDKLPEIKDDSVLVHFSNGSIETVHLDWFDSVTCGIGENGEQLYCKAFENHDPAFTHWMQLPEPPK